jgi:hypothetical protein
VIVLSLVLLAVAGVLLLVGIFLGPDGIALLVASIAVTSSAAALLYVGVRNRTASAAATRTGGGRRGREPAEALPRTAPVKAGTVAARAGDPSAEAGATTAVPPAQRPAGTPATAALPRAQQQQRQLAAVGSDDTASQGPDDDPPDEPGIEKVSLGELARIAGREDEVVVVDGRPRYHVRSCSELAAREPEGLPVSEAAELGFTPCAHCTPVAALLAGSGR